MKIHIVKQGDTLYALSQKYGVPMQKIMEANPQISNPEMLEVGGKVKIPSTPVSVPGSSDIYFKHTVKQGDTLWKLSKAWGISLQDMIAANPQLKNPNALLVGEMVNIPKNHPVPETVQSLQSAHSMNTPSHVMDKTQPGGKTFTGPIEEAPIPVPPAEPVAPIMPIQVPPVQEMMHSETQSLFVQISVPAQEVVSYYEMAPVPENEPLPMIQPVAVKQPEPMMQPVAVKQPTPMMQPAANKQPTPMMQPVAYNHPTPITQPCYCSPSAGYPGLTENPNFYDCPPAYPLYEPMYNQGVNAPMSYNQPTPCEPEFVAPYFYPNNNMCPPIETANPCYPNFIPSYTDTFEAGMINNNYPSPQAPQYIDPYQNMLPWPNSCGCGSEGHMHPEQMYSNEMPMNNSFPVYNYEANNAPYHSMMPQVPQYGGPATPENVYGAPMMTSIPPIPEYPGVSHGMFGYSERVSESQENLQFAVDTPVVSGIEEAIVDSGVVQSTSSEKVKTSSRTAKPVKVEVRKKQRSSTSKTKGNTPAKKRRNPWISN